MSVQRGYTGYATGRSMYMAYFASDLVGAQVLTTDGELVDDSDGGRLDGMVDLPEGTGTGGDYLAPFAGDPDWVPPGVYHLRYYEMPDGNTVPSASDDYLKDSETAVVYRSVGTPAVTLVVRGGPPAEARPATVLDPSTVLVRVTVPASVGTVEEAGLTGVLCSRPDLLPVVGPQDLEVDPDAPYTGDLRLDMSGLAPRQYLWFVRSTDAVLARGLLTVERTGFSD